MKSQAYFEKIHKHIEENLLAANDSIRIAVAWFTDRDIANAIINAKNKNLIVDIILSSNGAFHFLANGNCCTFFSENFQEKHPFHAFKFNPCLRIFHLRAYQNACFYNSSFQFCSTSNRFWIDSFFVID
jgi:hypothetical protein